MASKKASCSAGCTACGGSRKRHFPFRRSAILRSIFYFIGRLFLWNKKTPSSESLDPKDGVTFPWYHLDLKRRSRLFSSWSTAFYTPAAVTCGNPAAAYAEHPPFRKPILRCRAPGCIHRLFLQAPLTIRLLSVWGVKQLLLPVTAFYQFLLPHCTWFPLESQARKSGI